MIKAIPFIQTTGSEKFKKFITRPFTVDMLYPVFNEGSCDTLFRGWQCAQCISPYHTLINDSYDYVLEFRPDTYVIRKERGIVGYQLPLPQTINHFINDMERFGVVLYWTDWIDGNFEPKDYLSKEEVVVYYTDLLNKIGKSNELTYESS